tara:strand:- start:850 stop:1062 length:213 start_codon:yes stop_codon:yes gene_type:complete
MENDKEEILIKKNDDDIESVQTKSKSRLNVNTLIKRLKEENRNEKKFNLLVILITSFLFIGVFLVFNLYF